MTPLRQCDNWREANIGSDRQGKQWQLVAGQVLAVDDMASVDSDGSCWQGRHLQLLAGQLLAVGGRASVGSWWQCLAIIGYHRFPTSLHLRQHDTDPASTGIGVYNVGLLSGQFQSIN